MALRFRRLFRTMRGPRLLAGWLLTSSAAAMLALAIDVAVALPVIARGLARGRPAGRPRSA